MIIKKVILTGLNAQKLVNCRRQGSYQDFRLPESPRPSHYPVGWVDPWGLKKKSSSRKPIFVKTKSTARTKARNRNEKFAMDFAKKHPDIAEEIIKTNAIKDRCFKNKGWYKMSITLNMVEIHFMVNLDKNRKLLEITDFKFKDPETPEQRRKKERRKSISGNFV